jgi:hypothetical protein
MLSGDVVFHCPAAVLQSGDKLLALLPNIRVLGSARTCPYALDCDPGEGTISFGCVPYRLTRGTYCAHFDTDSVDVNGVLRYSYYLYYQGDCRAGDAVRQTSRRIWKLWGVSRVQSAPPHGAPLETCRAYAHTWLASGDAIPMHAAYGMALAAQRTANPTLAQQASTALDATLDHAQTNGFFDLPASYGPPDRASLSRPALMSWTAYWLCQWYGDVETDTRIPAFVKPYADALIALQKHGGHIPAWVEADRSTSGWLTRSAECSAHLLFLARLHAIDPQPEYERAARRLANFIIRELIPAHDWCATESYRGHDWLWRKRRPRGEESVPEPRAILAGWWMAEGLRALTDVTGTQRYRLCGERLLDELLLYQQLWDPPFIAMPCFGGFATGSNTTQWHDCIQALIGKTLMDYYVPSGLTEYFHRGVAAVGAAASMVYCRENAHTATLCTGRDAQRGYVPAAVLVDKPAAPTLSTRVPDYDGIVPSGIVATALEQVWRAYGDIYIDTRRSQAFGINGIAVDRIHTDLAGTAVSARELLHKTRDIVVRTDTGVSFPVSIKADAHFEIQV